MVPVEVILFLTALALLAIAALLAAGLYWSREPVKVRNGFRRASNLILRLLSYPLCLLALTLLFIGQWLMTIVRYTAGRVRGEPMTMIKITVAFD